MRPAEVQAIRRRAFAVLLLAAIPTALSGRGAAGESQTLPPAIERHPPPVPDFAADRALMLSRVRAQLEQAGVSGGARVRRILGAMGRIERERFVAPEARPLAYGDDPVNIGFRQTMSDPFIMAYMTNLLGVQPRDRVLEIGTGSGYQAALLGSLAGTVYTIEIVPELARQAGATLRNAGFRNVHVREGDGNLGWPEAAPFDAIIVTAGARRIPPALIQQLKPGGRMVIPLGPSWAQEQMTVVEKRPDGQLRVRPCGRVMFVPFVGAAQTPVPGSPPTLIGNSRGRCSEFLRFPFRPATPQELHDLERR